MQLGQGMKIVRRPMPASKFSGGIVDVDYNEVDSDIAEQPQPVRQRLVRPVMVKRRKNRPGPTCYI